MDYADAKRRLEATQSLFSGSTTSLEKLSAIRDLVRGLHKGIDEKLAQCEEAFSHIDKVASGDIVELSADHLPETTEEEKKRKKALLVFIRFWKDLQSEIARVQIELYTADATQSSASNVSVWKKILGAAKGPMGITTIVAVGIAIALQATSVHMTIRNNGCGTMTPGSLPIPLPGLSLPKDPIPNNSSAVATLPALTVSIDGTKSGMLYLQALKYMNISFQIPSDIRSVTLDGASLLKKNTEVKLGDRKEHEIVFNCK